MSDDVFKPTIRIVTNSSKVRKLADARDRVAEELRECVSDAMEEAKAKGLFLREGSS